MYSYLVFIVKLAQKHLRGLVFVVIDVDIVDWTAHLAKLHLVSDLRLDRLKRRLVGISCLPEGLVFLWAFGFLDCSQSVVHIGTWLVNRMGGGLALVVAHVLVDLNGRLVQIVARLAGD